MLENCFRSYDWKIILKSVSATNLQSGKRLNWKEEMEFEELAFIAGQV